MKKKLFLIVAILIIAVVACMSLVACGGTDGDSNNNNGQIEGEGNNGGGNQGGENIETPDITIKGFFDTWLNSSEKSVSQTAYGDIKMEINSNLYIKNDSESTKYIEITGKNKANYFYGKKDSTNLNDWTIEKLETFEEICENAGIATDYLQEITAPKDIINYAYNMCFGDADLDEVFEKKGDKYCGKQGTDFENGTIQIDNNVLTLTMNYESNNVTLDCKFSLGANQIEIPKFLKDALENLEEQPTEKYSNPKEFMDKFIASNEKVCTMVENQRTQILSLNGNIIKYKEDYEGVFESYYELVNDSINCYEYLASWSADTISKNAMTEGDDYDISNVANSDYMRELYNKGQDFGLYGWIGHLEYIALAFDLNNLDYIDGAYYGKVGTDVEGNKFEIIGNEFIVTYLSDDPDYTFIITFTIGCDTIEILQEAKDALQA